MSTIFEFYGELTLGRTPNIMILWAILGIIGPPAMAYLGWTVDI